MSRIIGLAAGTAGSIVAITQADLGPSWYPIALAVTAYPCRWFGGRLGAGPRTLKRALYG